MYIALYIYIYREKKYIALYICTTRTHVHICTHIHTSIHITKAHTINTALH